MLRHSTVLASALCVIIFSTALFEIQLILQTQTQPSSSASSLPFVVPPSWDHLVDKLQKLKAAFVEATVCSATDDKLRRAVTFLPLKDLRYAESPEKGHTWFMSSLHDTREKGEVIHQQFPSEASNGRLLCLKGRDIHDGAWNSYALAWPENLPYNATLMKGLTFICNTHYNYGNIWHGLSALFPFVAWHIKNGCSEGPARWVLFQKGELRTQLGATWLKTLMEATFSGPLNIERFDSVGGGGGDEAVCFEKAVVMRHNYGGMSRQRRIEVYDLIRCKAREHCNVSSVATTGGGGGGGGGIGMTLLMRSGARAFRNESAVVGIFEKECRKVKGCRLIVARSDNLTVCEQVKLMSLTDIMVSPHGAQLTNIFLMDRNSSVMEFFPQGWLKYAGTGQYVFHWMSEWSGMIFQGTYWEPDIDPCPYPGDRARCMNFYKNGRIGYNETYFSQWARDVLNNVKQRKLDETKDKSRGQAEHASGCACG